MRVTIKDVARRANVSQATVSLVLNDAPGVSVTTREHVRQVMQELNYTPDALARSFSSRRAKAVALVMPPWRESFDDPYFTQLLSGALEAVRDRGYQMLLEIADDRFTDQKLWQNLFACKRIDGLIVATAHLDQEYLTEIAAKNLPVVLINGARPDLPTLDYVGFDDFRGGVDATYYLIGLGHRRIAHFAGPQNHASAARRQEGYQEALSRARIPFCEEDVFPGDYRPGTAEAAMRQLLTRPAAERPTAIFCANDTVAVAAMRVAQDAGLSIPGDLSFIGMDDTGAAEAATPALTTMRQDIFALSRTAAEHFLTKLETRSPLPAPLTEHLPMELIERESCGPPPFWILDFGFWIGKAPALLIAQGRRTEKRRRAIQNPKSKIILSVRRAAR